jgi:CheY-like chemotaxis protein
MRRRVLVVDDDPDMRHAMHEVLIDEGLEVDLAADGREALASAEREPPSLIVLDITLPVLDGFAVADSLRQRHGRLPILAVTGDGRAPQKARRVGAYAYLRKPFELQTLVDLVKRGLANP